MGIRPLDNAQQSVMGMFGDTANGQAVNDMNTAMQDAHQKVTRVISNLTTGAAATDAAQRRADAIFNGGDSVAVKTGKINQLLAGMRNQIAGQTGQIVTTRARIGGAPTAGATANPFGGQTFAHTATGPGGHKIGWNGSAWVPAQ